MACTKCKEKRKLNEELAKSAEHIDKGALVFAVAWTLLGLYGLVTLVMKLI